MGTTRRKLKQGQINLIYDKTYSELKELAFQNRLTPKASYRITDYATKHRIPNTLEIYTAPVEPLIVTAKSTNGFFTEAKSDVYPNHKIEYRFDLEYCEDGATPRTGMIISRFDLDRNVFVGCDYVGVRYRRWKILDKLYREGVKVDDNNVTVTVPLNRPTLTSRHKYEVRFAVMTHLAGSVNVTMQYNNGVWVKPIKSYLDQEGTDLTANYLSGKKGTLIYNPSLDAFVFMDFVDIGSEAIGDYLAPTNSATFNIGHAITYTVDPNDYMDYPMFVDNHNETYIPTDHLSLGTTNYYPNVVFKSYAYRVKVNSYMRNVSFKTGVSTLDVGNFVIESLFLGAIQDLKIHKSAEDCLMLPSLSNFGYLRQEYYLLEDVTITPVLHLSSNMLMNMSLILNGISNFNATSIISDGNIFVGGINVGGSVPNNFYVTAPQYRCLIGYLDSRSLNISKTFNNQVLYNRLNVDNSVGENILGATKVDTLQLKTLPAPIGTVSTLGRDSEGNVVGGYSNIDGVTQEGAITILSGTQVEVSGYGWRINGADHLMTAPVSLTKPATDPNYNIIDIIVGTTATDLTYIAGEASESSPEPSVPAGTVFLGRVLRNSDGTTVVEGSPVSQDIYVKFNEFQDLTTPQRQQARTNIQAVSKDTADTRNGQLVQNGKLIVNGDYVQTVSNSTASANAWGFLNNVQGGASYQRRGSHTIIAKGDSMTNYFIQRGFDNTLTEVYRFRQGGVLKLGKGINGDDAVTFDQLRRTTKVVTTTTYTLLASDIGVKLNFTSDLPVTVTVPPLLDAIEARFEGKQLGLGQVSFVGSTVTPFEQPSVTSVIKVGASELAKTAEQYSVFGLDLIDTETYHLFGKLQLV